MQAKNEVTLVDLLVVVIKHRRLIGGAAVLSAVVSGVIFFGLPLFGIVSFRTYTVSAIIIPNQLPPSLQKELGIEPFALTAAYAQNVIAISDNAARNRLVKKPLGDPDGLLFRTYIARSFIGQQYSVAKEQDKIVLQVRVKNVANGRAFISEIIAYTEERVRADIATRCAIIVKSMESLYKEASSLTALSDSTRQIIISSMAYAGNDVPSLVIPGTPDVFVDAQGRSGKFLFAVLTSIFLALVTSFIIEYVHHIREDPENSQKIRRAWGEE